MMKPAIIETHPIILFCRTAIGSPGLRGELLNTFMPLYQRRNDVCHTLYRYDERGINMRGKYRLFYHGCYAILSRYDRSRTPGKFYNYIMLRIAIVIMIIFRRTIIYDLHDRFDQ